jgi:hypothetical protein
MPVRNVGGGRSGCQPETEATLAVAARLPAERLAEGVEDAAGDGPPLPT